jgi:hypothetical protein
MAEDEVAATPGDRFPLLKPLEESVERAKLRQALVEANAATLKAQLPSFDGEVQQDTVVMSDKTSGLARVLVQFDSSTLADDIADRALMSARASTTASARKKRPTYVFHVIADPAVFKDVDAYHLLNEELDLLIPRVMAFAPDTDFKTMFDPLTVSVLVGAGISAVGLLTKLLAREYTLSGTQVSVDDLGLDLEIADALQKNKEKDERVEVTVDRVMPTPATGEVLQKLRQLASLADQALIPKLAASAAALEKASAAAESSTAEIASIDERIIELLKRIPDSSKASPLMDELNRLKDAQTGLRQDLLEQRETLARERDAHDRGTALLADIKAFLTAALTASGGNRAPALQAARGEMLAAKEKAQGHFVLYARLLAGGIDQEVEKKIGPDRFLVMAGATAEYALLNGEGRLLGSKVSSLLEASTMNLTEPDTFRRLRVGYMDFHRTEIQREDE